MPISLEKVTAEAPHMVPMYKQAIDIKSELGFDPEKDKAAVVATIDDSGSARHLFDSGVVQRVTDLAFAAGLVFDDDGSVPASFFNNRIQDLGEITLANSKGFIGKQTPQWGGTNYTSALKWIIDSAGFGNVNLKSGGLFKRGKQEVKATADYPTFAIFVTDGEPSDGNDASELLKMMSQLPIFVQFIGIGPSSFSYLKGLDTMSEGRLIDNAGFFKAEDVNDGDAMLRHMLGEFPSYLRDARAAGLVRS